MPGPTSYQRWPGNDLRGDSRLLLQTQTGPAENRSASVLASSAPWALSAAYWALASSSRRASLRQPCSPEPARGPVFYSPARPFLIVLGSYGPGANQVIENSGVVSLMLEMAQGDVGARRTVRPLPRRSRPPRAALGWWSLGSQAATSVVAFTGYEAGDATDSIPPPPGYDGTFDGCSAATPLRNRIPRLFEPRT